MPARSTVCGYFDLWDYDGTLMRIPHALFVQCREQAGREASPTAAIIDSRSVKGAEKWGVDRSAWLRRWQEDEGKKRHILVDTQGLLMHALVHSAGMQDRDGGVWMMATVFGLRPTHDP